MFESGCFPRESSRFFDLFMALDRNLLLFFFRVALCIDSINICIFES
jgi:hypothetical protein